MGKEEKFIPNPGVTLGVTERFREGEEPWNHPLWDKFLAFRSKSGFPKDMTTQSRFSHWVLWWECFLAGAREYKGKPKKAKEE